jgi:hypothetical protein
MKDERNEQLYFRNKTNLALRYSRSQLPASAFSICVMFALWKEKKNNGQCAMNCKVSFTKNLRRSHLSVTCFTRRKIIT